MRLTYLLLSPTFGMHQYTADLANRMAELFDVQLVTTRGYPEDRYGPAIEVQTPVEMSDTGLSLESLAVGRLAQVKRALAESRPDVVHITGPHLWNVPLVRWLRRRGIPVIHTIHDLDPHHGKSYGRLLHLWNWAIIRSADHVLVHGEVYRKRLLASGLRPERVSCTPLTHLFVSYDMGRQLASDPLDVCYEPLVLFFGRLERYKGVDTLLKAFGRLQERLAGEQSGIHASLVLAGPGDGVEEKVSDNSPDVEWHNYLIGDEEGVALFRRCAVVVLPYRDATQSAVVAAAYFFAKPVIVTAVGALAEYVDPGNTGLVVGGEDVEEELAGAMHRMIIRTGHAQSLGRAGRAWYDEQRTRETQVLVQLYEKWAI